MKRSIQAKKRMSGICISKGVGSFSLLEIVSVNNTSPSWRVEVANESKKILMPKFHCCTVLSSLLFNGFSREVKVSSSKNGSKTTSSTSTSCCFDFYFPRETIDYGLLCNKRNQWVRKKPKIGLKWDSSLPIYFPCCINIPISYKE